MRLHPYLTDRMLARVAALTPAAGSRPATTSGWTVRGYPAGLFRRVAVTGDRLLAAADVYHAMTEPRAYRPAFGFDRAADELRAEVRAGRLDGDAVNAVLTAAGHRARPAATGPPA